MIFLDVASVAQNITDIATQQTVQSIQDEATGLFTSMLLKLGFSILTAIGVAKADIKEIKTVLAILGAISGLAGIIDLLQLMPLLLQGVTP